MEVVRYNVSWKIILFIQQYSGFSNLINLLIKKNIFSRPNLKKMFATRKIKAKNPFILKIKQSEARTKIYIYFLNILFK